MSLSVTLLGTGSPLISADRAGPATLVRSDDAALLFDAGRGVLLRLTAAGVVPAMLDAVLLTHLHSDHITDLNDVITTQWVMGAESTPLTLIGPGHTQSLVDATLAMLELDIGYRIEHHDDLTWRPDVRVTEVAEGVAWQGKDLTVTAAPTEHAPVRPTVGYRVENADGVIAVAGDTIPCPGLDALVAGADVYVQTVIRADFVEAMGIPRLDDVLDYHSTVEQAAQTAARSGVSTLVFTHLVPAPPLDDSEQEQIWIDLARPHFDGEIVVGRDLTTVEV